MSGITPPPGGITRMNAEPVANYVDAYKFTHRGRDWTIFRRKAGGSFSIRITYPKGRRMVALGTPMKPAAVMRAKLKIDELFKGDEPKPAAKGLVTIGEILKAYDSADKTLARKTRMGNAGALRRVVSAGTGTPQGEMSRKWERVDALSSAVLTADCVRAFQGHAQGKPVPDYKAVLAPNTGANSALQQARSVFSRDMMAHYEALGLRLPELKGFMTHRTLNAPSHRYKPIPQETIDRMMAELPALKERDDRLWAIVLMALTMGLRDSEIMRAGPHHVQEIKGNHYLAIVKAAGEAAPKRSEGMAAISTELKEWILARKGTHLIEAPTESERYNLVYKKACAWVRRFIRDRTKALHELRKHAGSVVLEKTGSIERAAQFLRISTHVARLHYASFLTPAEPLGFADLTAPASAPTFSK